MRHRSAGRLGCQYPRGCHRCDQQCALTRPNPPPQPSSWRACCQAAARRSRRPRRRPPLAGGSAGSAACLGAGQGRTTRRRTLRRSAAGGFKGLRGLSAPERIGPVAVLRPRRPATRCTHPARQGAAGQGGSGGDQPGGVVLVDVGTFRWRDDGGGGGGAGPDQGSARCPVHGEDAARGEGQAGGEGAHECSCPPPPSSLHLVQALPSSLSSRLMLLPWPLPACIGEVGGGGRSRDSWLGAPHARLRGLPLHDHVTESPLTNPHPLNRTRCWSRLARGSWTRQVGFAQAQLAAAAAVCLQQGEKEHSPPAHAAPPPLAGAWVSCPTHMRRMWELCGLPPPPKPEVTIVFATAVGLKEACAISTQVQARVASLPGSW
jgi:hypothetical protein